MISLKLSTRFVRLVEKIIDSALEVVKGESKNFRIFLFTERTL